MSFYTSLSGLQASQTDMNTISHNLANVSTTGFKKSRVEFSDVIASSVSTDPRKMVGSGVIVKATQQQFKNGNLQGTTNALDLAVMGEGFFTVRTSGASDAIAYTRNGSFSVDSTRNVVDSQGSLLLVYPVDGDGNVTATGEDGLTNLQLQQTSGTPEATKQVATGINLSATSTVNQKAFDRTDTTTYNNSVATRIYDANGNPMTMTNYYVRAAPNADGLSKWVVHTYIGDDKMVPESGTNPAVIKFSSTGAIASTSEGTVANPLAPIKFKQFIPLSGAAAQTVTLDLANSTQLSSAFAVNSKTQDGVAVGQLSGVTVNSEGLISASFSNGDIVPLGKVALAKFSTPTGLRQIGNSYWSATGLSGSASMGSASADGFGSLMSGQIEGSNVDVAEELVNLIAAQRNFQANSKALDTANQVSQTIIQIRN